MKRMLLLSIMMLLLTTATIGQDRTIELKVIETSDVHGYFFPFDFFDQKPIKGTLARANTYINREREKYGDRLLLIDNGDILQGQPTCYWTNFVMPYNENVAASVVNYMGYDAETVGNHDIETGHKVFDKWIREVRCPVIGANIISQETKLPYVQPYAIIKRNGVKIAILGMVTPTIPCWLNESIYQGLEFQEMVTCAKYWVDYIQKVEKPDLIFGLFHSGLEGGIVLDGGIEENATAHVAHEVPGFDIIFFGHDHQVHNEWITNIAEKKVLCIDPSCYVNNVAEATIKLTYTNGKVSQKEINGRIVNVRDEEVDKQMMTHFQPQIEEIKKYVSRKIGRFTIETSTRDSYFGSSAFIDFIHNTQLQLSGADISFNAPLSFDSKIKAGDVTISDMFKLYRFENQLYILKMTGREIRQHLEMSYDLWVNTMKSPKDHLLMLSENSVGDQQRMGFTNMTFNFDSAAGIDYEVDVTKPDGKKVHILRMSNGKPFKEDAWYKVVMNSYRGNGGGELLTHGAGIPKDSLNKRIIYQSPKVLRDYLAEEIERQGTVTPKANNNWRFVPEKWTKAAAKRDRKILFHE